MVTLDVVVVAKTRMGKLLCIGAVEERQGRSSRLIPSVSHEYHGWHSFEPKIGERLTVVGVRDRDCIKPHVEDFIVERYVVKGERIADLVPWITDRCEIWSGLPTLFGGHLEATEAGSRFLESGGTLPQASVGFWQLPFALYRRESFENNKRTAGR